MMYLKVWVIDNQVDALQTSDMEIDWLAIEPRENALIFDAEIDCDYCDSSEIMPLIGFDGKKLTGLDFKSQSFIEWKAPIVPDEQLEQEALDKRKSLLVSSDWTQLPDARNAMGADRAAEWDTYRQDLRDITAQAGFPREIEWPTKPE